MLRPWRAAGPVVVSLIGVGWAAACGGTPPPFEPDKGGSTTPNRADASTSNNQDTDQSLGDAGPPKPPTDDNACAATETAAIRAQVDIIVAIDTSGSMSEETTQVQQNINTFAAAIGNSGLDYQVVMVAQKPTPFPFPLPIPTPGICVPPPLAGANCADNPPKFHHVPTMVNSTDAPDVLLRTYDSTWKAWARPDAYKVFIVITDDDATMKSAPFDTALLGKAPSGMFGTATKRKYIFDSICGWKENTPILDQSKCDSAVNNGSVYQELSKLTTGIVDSVCKTSYASVFDNIAKGLVTKLGCEFAMPKPDGGVADPEKVVVQYTPGAGPNQGKPGPLTQVTDASKCAQIPNAWHYDNNASPSKIVFCPSTCTSAGADTGGKISILLGCKKNVPQ